MIIVLKQDAPDVQVREFCHELEGMGLQINDSKGSDTHILGLIGDTKAIAESWVLANPVVETCRRVSEPYKKANRKFHPDDSIIDVDGVKIGGGNFAIIAGPCSIESEEQITYCAQRVKAAGASLLRGGAFKPRTSPYSFQGMRSEGLDLLKLARRATGAPIVTEIMNTEHLPLFENVDLIQVGARNMQNFELLKAVGRQKKPVLLKRGLANTLEEFVMSAEYIMAEGNENVILCERGIRTFETSMRNTLDLAGVVMLHKMTHLPVVVDPSHACGHAWMVPQLAKAAVCAGVDTLLRAAGRAASEVETVWLAGGFGCKLPPDSAGAVGLLPRQLIPAVRPSGNTAAMGAALLLCSRRFEAETVSIAAAARLVDLSTSPVFQQRFVEDMTLSEVTS